MSQSFDFLFPFNMVSLCLPNKINLPFAISIIIPLKYSINIHIKCEIYKYQPY